MAEDFSADKAGKVTFLVELTRDDTDWVVMAESRVWEAYAPSMLAGLNAATYHFCFAVRAGLKELAMPRVGPADQYRPRTGINYGLNNYRFTEFESYISWRICKQLGIAHEDIDTGERILWVARVPIYFRETHFRTRSRQVQFPRPAGSGNCGSIQIAAGRL